MEVILIRHTSVDVPPGVCYGQTDVPLKATFEQEAAVTAAGLKAFLPFDKVYTSPLTRCVRLAAYCGYPDATRDRRIMEINFGAWEMKPFQTNDDPRLKEWYADYLNVAATGGESFAMQYQRVSQFLDELKKELAKIREIAIERTRMQKLRDFQKKLASLTFLDPACGSGNFLTETYISLRKLENEILYELQKGQVTLGAVTNPIKVSIKQFYGIEINDFVYSV